MCISGLLLLLFEFAKKQTEIEVFQVAFLVETFCGFILTTHHLVVSNFVLVHGTYGYVCILESPATLSMLSGSLLLPTA